MKKIIILLMLVVTSFTTFAKDRILSQVSELPETSRTFIDKYYKAKEISHIKTEGYLLWKEYEIIFMDGAEVEFNDKGEWKSISSKIDTIPSEIIPEKIREYMNKNYSGKKINKIERYGSGYELKINKGLELKFDKEGNFKRLDD